MNDLQKLCIALLLQHLFVQAVHNLYGKSFTNHYIYNMTESKQKNTNCYGNCKHKKSGKLERR